MPKVLDPWTCRVHGASAWAAGLIEPTAPMGLDTDLLRDRPDEYGIHCKDGGAGETVAFGSCS